MASPGGGAPNPYAQPTSTCRACGHELIRGRPRCGNCGQPVGGGPGRAVGGAFERPGLITVLSVLYFLSAAMFLIAAPLMGFAAISDPSASPLMVIAIISGVMGVAYVAVPVNPGLTGARAFCSDATGMVCATYDGIEPTVVDGACAPGCEPF